MPYLSHIRSTLVKDSVEWEFSWHSESDKNRILEIVNGLNIKNFTLIKLTDKCIK